MFVSLDSSLELENFEKAIPQMCSENNLKHGFLHYDSSTIRHSCAFLEHSLQTLQVLFYFITFLQKKKGEEDEEEEKRF